MKNLRDQIEQIKKSTLFDPAWYLSNYSEVSMLSLDPVEHYVKYGARLLRNPSLQFSTARYLQSNPDVAQMGINPLYHYLKWGSKEGRNAPSCLSFMPNRNRNGIKIEAATEVCPEKKTNQSSIRHVKEKKFKAEDLRRKLWGGFSRYAIPQLEQLKNDVAMKKSERICAAWHLTRWFYLSDDLERAYENLTFIRLLRPKNEIEKILAEIQCLIRLERFGVAAQKIELATKAWGEKPDFLLLQSTVLRLNSLANGINHAQVDAEQLSILNKIFKNSGLAPIKLKSPEKQLNFSNITASATPKSFLQTEKVSVIIPAYNAEEMIDVALESLLAQTWRNIEIIVVDDCSTDGTCKVVESFVSKDQRVKLIRKEFNEGAYPTRNRALENVTGEFIMVHDSDDWSHPQKLELQIEALTKNKSCVASMSEWVRVDEHLQIIGPWLPKGTLFDLNFSSLMFTRDVLNRLGGWDFVQVGGDAEFRSRLMTVYGQNSICKPRKGLLLSLSLTRDNSLTRTKATHVRSLLFGLRWQYRDAYQYWHKQNNLKIFPLLSNEVRKFPVPLGNRPCKIKMHKYDIIIVSDLALRGGAFVSTLNYIVAACKSGMRVAVVHWRRYDLNPFNSLNLNLYDACIKYGIDILTHGDKVDTDVVLIGYPSILQHKPDSFPCINTKHLVVIINQYTARLSNGTDEQYDPIVARSNLVSLFGQEGDWIPISAWMKRLMQEDKRYPIPYPKPWFPMIDAQSWCAAPLRWRGNERNIPVVGRHCRDAYTKWPSNKTSLRLAYGIGQAWEVRFLGGAEHAIKLLGKQPKNWCIMPFSDNGVQQFLSDLDFYIHYPHEEMIEAFGRAIMESMAVGIPVILPEQFKETFGHAALYAKPGEVGRTVADLWSSEMKYLERARIAREFVLKNCDISTIGNRLHRLFKSRKTSGIQP